MGKEEGPKVEAPKIEQQETENVKISDFVKENSPTVNIELVGEKRSYPVIFFSGDRITVAMGEIKYGQCMDGFHDIYPRPRGSWEKNDPCADGSLYNEVARQLREMME